MLNINDEIISDEEYSIELKKMNEYCDDKCTKCSRKKTCHFIEIEGK